jgi:hypothetical protein
MTTLAENASQMTRRQKPELLPAAGDGRLISTRDPTGHEAAATAAYNETPANTLSWG